MFTQRHFIHPRQSLKIVSPVCYYPLEAWSLLCCQQNLTYQLSKKHFFQCQSYICELFC